MIDDQTDVYIYIYISVFALGCTHCSLLTEMRNNIGTNTSS